MKEDRIWTRGFIILTLANSLNCVGMHMLTPTIPLYLVSLGAAESQIGMIATLFYVTSIVMRMVVNLLILKTRKKHILVVGMMLSFVVMLLYGITGTITAAAILRTIHGFGFGITTTITTTMAADMLPDSRRGEGIGYFAMGIVLAMSIAPAISLFISSYSGFLPMFFTAAGFFLISAVIAMFAVEQPVIVDLSAGNPEKTAWWRNLFDMKLIIPASLLLLVGISRSADASFIAIFAEERSLQHLPWYYAIQSLTMFCIRFIVGRFADRKGRNWVLIPGALAMLALGLTLSFTKTSAMMLCGAVFSGLGIGVLAPGMQLWMLSVVSPERRNIASSAYYNFTDIGISIGAMSMGFTAENFGYPTMFRLASLAALFYLTGFLALGRQKRAKPI